MKKLEVYQMDHGELDSLINKTFYNGKEEYCFIAFEEMNDGMEKLYTGINAQEPVGYSKEKIEEIINGNYSNAFTSDFLKVLCLKGLIPEGNFLISAWW